jgi:hypothetical protein
MYLFGYLSNVRQALGLEGTYSFLEVPHLIACIDGGKIVFWL